MALGLFGKLPSKRDFVSFNAHRPFLEKWEPWLQASVATSRQLLGEAWLDAFRSAPIWRFWLGSAICGLPVAGAFMPSIDAVGRYFPLTIFGSCEGGVPPPEIDPQHSWFEGVEATLLSALDPDIRYEDITHAIEHLPQLEPEEANINHANLIALRPSGLILTGYGDDVGAALMEARRVDHLRSFATFSSWWTIGGESYFPTAFTDLYLPHETILSGMLTGKFDSLR